MVEVELMHGWRGILVLLNIFIIDVVHVWIITKPIGPLEVFDFFFSYRISHTNTSCDNKNRFATVHLVHFGNFS